MNYNFTTVTFGEEHPNAQNTWPNKTNGATYKFNSLWLELNQRKTLIERETYNLLEWFSDVGGLMDGLFNFSYFLITPITTLMLQKIFMQIANVKIFICCILRRRSKRKMLASKAKLLASLDLQKFIELQRLVILASFAALNAP